MKRILGRLVVTAAVLGAASVRDVPYSLTQVGLHEAADKDLKAAEAQLTSLLKALEAKGSGKADSLTKLRSAQDAWVKYRDAQLLAEWPHPDRGEYGSVYPMCFLTERTRLTKARIVEVRSMLSPKEGEACASQWPD
ncbi:MAG TPA: lysozyme inhibitor LprI family protein [Candidatus Polarisedimenticolaceae bacterium]|nr:lysozyme inhibitor LprI family protein [Candidatus Polarisedimenticolaceae bacterium]